MIQLALAGLGEVLALYPVDGSHEPITRIEAALASEKPAEQIRTKCSIPTIALSVQVMPVRSTPVASVATTSVFAGNSEDVHEAVPPPGRRGHG